jgi:hypothetical protein
MLKLKAMKTRSVRFNQIIFSTMLVMFLLAANMNVTGADIAVAADLERVAEAKLVLEEWMVSGKYWEVSSANTIEHEAGPVCGIESWMLDESKWDFKPVINIVAVSEEELKIESWMISERLWN